MQVIASSIVKLGIFASIAGSLAGVLWWHRPSQPPARALPLRQNWELQLGQVVGGHVITGGLGDVSIALRGASVYAPFNGKVEPHRETCVLFSSPEVPAYLFRFCGLTKMNFGAVEAGKSIGSANYLQFAALRKQPDGTWSLVEPSQEVLERTLVN